MQTNNSSRVRAVALAGGSGTRLWPLSRRLLPKQFIGVDGGKPLLETTLDRLALIAGEDGILVITSNLHYYGAGYNLVKPHMMIIEPAPRNTAPAVALAAEYFLSRGEDPVLFVSPSDHVIRDEQAFQDAAGAAVEAARNGGIILVGIKPDRGETRYGYIETASPGPKNRVSAVSRFIEKPSSAQAAGFVKAGNYLWHSGALAAKASVLSEEFRRRLPVVSETARKIRNAAFAGAEIDYSKFNALFPDMPDISVDYGLLEKSDILSAVACDPGWLDIESWNAVYEAAQKDGRGNAAAGDTVALDCDNTFLYSSKRLVTAVGLKDTAVIETPDALLVCPLERTPEIVSLIPALKEDYRVQLHEHLTVRRPWGSYTQLEDTPDHKVKRLTVAPGQKISLQYHKRRSEHWVVISGNADVILNDEQILLSPNQSVDIPAGARHRLYNPGKEPLELIEVQSGDYFGEDDIIRLEDEYGRPRR